LSVEQAKTVKKVSSKLIKISDEIEKCREKGVIVISPFISFNTESQNISKILLLQA